MIKTVLFDLDDTLVVEVKTAHKAIIETVKSTCAEINLDPDKFKVALLANARKLWYQMATIRYCKDIGISSWEGLWGKFIGNHPSIKQLAGLIEEYRIKAWAGTLQEYGIQSEDLAEELSTSFQSYRRKFHTLYPESREILDSLYGRYAMAIVSNGAPSLQREKIFSVGLEKYFDLILVSGDIDIRKPDPSIFAVALKRLQISNKEAIMVGDKISSDITGAKRAGIISVWVNRDGEPVDKEISPDYTIQNLKHLPEILKEMG